MVSTDSPSIRPWTFRTAVCLGLLLCAGSGCRAPRAPEESPVERWQTLLLQRAPLSARERVEQARAVLRADRIGRVEELHQRTLEAAWRVALRASPQRIWTATRRIYGAVRRFGKPRGSEQVALGWLEPGLGQALDAERGPLYGWLSDRERGRVLERTLVLARAALEANRFDVSRQLLERARELDPGHERAHAFAEELATREAEWHRLQPALKIRSWDADLAPRLLTADFESALAFQPDPPGDAEVEFARATALLILGRRDPARATFRELADRSDELGRMASRWLERPEVDLEGELDRTVRAYRVKRVLGWIGGNALAERGRGLSHSSFDAWKHAFTLTNMGVSLPARILRGWRPDPTPVQEAAARYLEERPDGPSRDRALAWLEDLGWPEVDALGLDRPPRLPTARASFDRIRVPPVIVSHRAVIGGGISGSSALLSALEGSDAVRLEVRPVRLPIGLEDGPELTGFALIPRTARRLIDELAAAVERDQLRFTLRSREAALERLRRIDAALGRGWVLFAEPWAPPPQPFWSSFATAAVDGADQRGTVALERGEDDLLAVHVLGDQVAGCPRGVLCLDRDGALRTSFYGYVDVTSGAGFGFQSASRLLGMGLGVTESGPELTLVLPIASWLGIDNWLPIEAELSLSGDTPYAGPVLRRKKCSDAHEDPDEASLKRLLPLGLRSRCVLHLY